MSANHTFPGAERDSPGLSPVAASAKINTAQMSKKVAYFTKEKRISGNKGESITA
jgi:hypothetical protein